MINSKVIILIYKIIIAALVIVASVVVFREIKSFNKYILYRMKIQLLQNNEHLLIVSTMFYDEKNILSLCILYSVLFYYNFYLFVH
jgi:hypothetical protein